MKPHLSQAAWACLGWTSLVKAVSETPFGDYVDPCPISCASAGPDRSKWTQFHKTADLGRCDDPILFDFNFGLSVDEIDSQIKFRTCSLVTSKTNDNTTPASVSARDANINPDTASFANNCNAATKQFVTSTQTGTSLDSLSASSSEVSSAVDSLLDFLTDNASCGSNVLFSRSGNSVVGIYSGAEVHKDSTINFINTFKQHSSTGISTMQVCQKTSGASHTLGIFSATLSDLGSVQNALSTWVSSECLAVEEAQLIQGFNMKILTSAFDTNTTTIKETPIPSTLSARFLNRRADCQDRQVVEGDSCASLATQCKISGPDFMKYNPQPNLCSTLKVKQYVCCSAGTLPDRRPKKQADGSCHTYEIKGGDDCWGIADRFGITVDTITGNNTKTWGWAGCGYLQENQPICLSAGTPPFPKPVSDTMCGPLVPGTKKPTDGTPIEKLNPCPLNSCCNVWGFCGVTAEFCTPSPADTGAPGTAKPGTNGCISNCGTGVVNNASPPSTFRKIGYFEAWNKERPCLTMDVTQVDTSVLTHIHFAFATVSPDWKVVLTKDIQAQFDKFKKMTTIKKVLSFGGWTFSTDPATFQLFRDATKPANREAFANNCVQFLKDNNLDGLDFDWEYPGAPDIPGIPRGTKEETENYLEFLKLVRAKIPSGKEVSIAIPASYWYLKQYPVDKMHSVLDYFIYMSYDFHGQWDHGNGFATEGCPEGNCLRSHVNSTETLTSLSMITKAGVPANKVIVGISSYGRSFGMADPNCKGPMCRFTGSFNVSNATPGRCTKTAGYISNAEIGEIIKSPGSHTLVQSSYDSASDSNILVYGSAQKATWVAYMDATTKASRVNWYKGLNFGGSTDWAVDLEKFAEDIENPVCKDSDGKYSTEPITAGTFMPPYLMAPENAAVSGKQYMTIVNLTPHRFKLLGTSSYQIAVDFTDIPPGRSRQNLVNFAQSGWVPTDSAAEMYYGLEGTDKKFEIRARFRDGHRLLIPDLTGMGLGQREYKTPEQEVSVALVISGSTEYGFVASIRHGPGNWMRGMYDVIKDRKIREIVMPGTHDSGMSEISDKFVGLGTKSNTQNQGINLYDQLRAGARWIDLRVLSINNPDGSKTFYTAHVNDEVSNTPVGNSGESLSKVIQEINQFTTENPGEVIFVKLRYLIGVTALPTIPVYWTDTNKYYEEFVDKLKGVNNRCKDLDTSGDGFQSKKTSYFMDQNGKKGCVIFLLDKQRLKYVSEPVRVNEGIYELGSMGVVSDHWSNKETADVMAADQVPKWSQNKNAFRVSQWLVNPSVMETSLSNSIEVYALLQSNPALYWYADNHLSPKNWPNVFLLDYIGVSRLSEYGWDQLNADIYAFCIGINLYLISENCEINSKRSPMLPKLGAIKKRELTGLMDGWNGVILANGTVVDNPPPGLHYGRVETWKAGTVFSNGTVLAFDMPNPEFNSTALEIAPVELRYDLEEQSASTAVPTLLTTMSTRPTTTPTPVLVKG